MKTRRLGTTGAELSTVGLGTWAHGGGQWTFGWGPQDDEASVKTIRAAVDAGINWVDTAAVYGLGHAEEVLGRALAELREKPFVATKCGLVWDSKGAISGKLSRRSVRAECEASLKRLRLDRIDLYQIHWPMPDDQIEEGWGAIAELIDEGKIRFGGVSNFSPGQLRRVEPIRHVASLQPPYSMLERGIERELVSLCRQNGTGIVAYSPLQKGLLTGKVTRDYIASLPPDDHRRADPLFNEPRITTILRQVDALKKIARARGITPAQLALAWILRRSEVTSAIAGARKPEDIRETAAASDIELGTAEVDAVEKVLVGG